MNEKTIRLKQVATTLNISTSTVVDFLSGKGFDIENKPTSKITFEQFNMLLKAFEAVLQAKIEATELNIDKKHPQPAVNYTRESEALKDELRKPPVKPETYHTKKPALAKKEGEAVTTGIDLQGLKVSSKIDLNALAKPIYNSAAPTNSDSRYNQIDYNAADFFDDETPEILYKYRCWGEGFPFHQRMIINNEIYFSSPTKFNDPFDVNIPFRFDLLNAIEKRQYCLELAKQLYPNYSRANRRRKAQEIEQSPTFARDNLKNTSIKVIEEFRNNVGVVSLSKDRSNILLWSHYADSHKGICIGFNTEKLLSEAQCRLNKVLYSEDYPVLKYVLDKSEDVIQQLITKSSLWKYEEEFRLIRGNFSNKSIELSSEVFEEIILGCQMSQEDKISIKKIIREKFKDIKILEAIQDQNKFKLTFVEV